MPRHNSVKSLVKANGVNYFHNMLAKRVVKKWAMGVVA
jgi:hypothetical protein